jgi:dTDP-4-amino-4,6-dideoxygalactose transaminase
VILPVYHQMTDEEQQRVIDAIRSASGQIAA